MKSYEEMIRERRMLLKAHNAEPEEWELHSKTITQESYD
jgi:hypothetical protein